MLEVCLRVAADAPKIDFILYELVIVQGINCVNPIYKMPNLPNVRVIWQVMPDIKTCFECWIMAGRAYHTILTFDVLADQMHDLAKI